MVPGLQDGLQWPSPIHTLVQPPSAVKSADLGKKCCTNDGVWLLRLFDHSLWEKPAVMSWRASCGPMEKRSTWQGTKRHTANTQHQLSNHVHEPSWKWILQPSVEPSGGCSPGWHLDHNLLRDPALEPCSKATPDPQKLSRIINVYCYFKPLHFRVICYSNRELIECIFQKAM